MAQLMNKTLKCDADQIVEIMFASKPKLTVDDKEITLTEGTTRYLRFSGAVMLLQGINLSLRNRISSHPTRLEMSPVNVAVRYYENGSQKTQNVSKVNRIAVGSDMIEIRYEAPAVTGGNGGTSTGSSTGAVTGGTSTGTGTTPRRPVEPADHPQQAKVLEETIKQLNEERRKAIAAQAEANRWRDLAEQNVDQMLARYRAGQSTGSDALNKKLTELARLQDQGGVLDGQMAQAQQDIDNQIMENQRKEEELARLREELTQLRSQAEIFDLDCEKATEEVEAQRTRLQMDGDIVTLTESRWLKNNSVSDTLEEIEKKLSAAEDRIGRILKLRETFGSIVQSTVLGGGDGTISAAQEAGETADPAPTGEGENVTDEPTGTEE